MMRRRKTLILCLLSICLISGVIVYKNNQPKNIFEEIYEAEMSAAETNCTIDKSQKKIADAMSGTSKENINSQTKQKTPLSNTEYFNGTDAEMNDKGGRLRIRTVKELPKEGSPYTLTADLLTYIDTRPPFWTPFNKQYDLLQKSVNIGKVSLYRDVELEMQYQYVSLREGEFEGEFSTFQKGEGLYISVRGSIAGHKLTNLEDFADYGLTESELKDKAQQDLDYILNYWVENYPHSKFKHNDFGMFEIVELK